jgi:hypothetical protein
VWVDVVLDQATDKNIAVVIKHKHSKREIELSVNYYSLYSTGMTGRVLS